MTPEKAIACIDEVLISTVNYDESLEYEMTSYDIDWLEEARTALKARTKKKPIELGKYNFICPACEKELGVSKEDISIYDMTPPEHCDNCGQALDWGDTHPPSRCIDLSRIGGIGMSDVITTVLECVAVLGYIWLYATKRNKLIAWEDKHIFAPMRRLRCRLRRFIRNHIKSNARFMTWLNKPVKHGVLDDEWRIGQIKVFGDVWR